MRVLLGAVSFSAEMTGVQRHVFNAARCLLTQPDISAVQLVIAPWQQELAHKSMPDRDARLSIHIAKVQRDAFRRNRWYYQGLPEIAMKFGAEVVHVAYPVPLDARAYICPTVVTLHDLYPYEIPSNFGFPKVLFNRMITQHCLRNADAIVCVSDITRHLLTRYASLPIQHKAARIYNCVEPTVSSLQVPVRDWGEAPFLLCIAQHRRNKNLPFLIQVLRRLIRSGGVDQSMRLVIVGIQGPETARIRRTILQSNLSNNVVLTEGLSEAELHWCYGNCQAVLAPSTTEGFGLPIAEALMAGCRIVCSDIPAFRELGTDSIHYVRLDAGAEGAFAAAIVAALKEPRREPVTMAMLSAAVVGEQYIRLYKQLLMSDERVHDTVSDGLSPTTEKGKHFQ
jgi:glycosyltransferase involved in cell wall biosynthesis